MRARTRFTRTIRKFFGNQVQDVAAQITTAIAGLSKADEQPKKPKATKSQVDDVLEQLDFSSWTDLYQQLGPTLISVTQDGISAGFDQIGADPDKDIVDQANQDAISWAKDRAADMVGMMIDEDGSLVPNDDPDMAITESTREMLRADVADAIEEGLSTSELADQLEESYAFSSDRAQRIAHFEIAQADVQGNLTAYKTSGEVRGKEWVLGSEHDEMDECDDAAGMGEVPLDSDFGGFGDPPMHPNCGCDILPVLDDDGEDDDE